GRLTREILAWRAEQAQLLGYDNYAGYRLDDTMAKTSEAAEPLLRQVWSPAKRKAAEERAELAEAALSDGLNEPIAAWDWRYYAEKGRQARYDIDETAGKPDFRLDHIAPAAFERGRRRLRVEFIAGRGAPGYPPD